MCVCALGPPIRVFSCLRLICCVMCRCSSMSTRSTCFHVAASMCADESTQPFGLHRKASAGVGVTLARVLVGIAHGASVIDRDGRASAGGGRGGSGSNRESWGTRQADVDCRGISDVCGLPSSLDPAASLRITARFRNPVGHAMFAEKLKGTSTAFVWHASFSVDGPRFGATLAHSHRNMS